MQLVSPRRQGDLADPADRLELLVEEAINEHTKGSSMTERAVACFARAGEVLIATKARVGHRNWGRWVEAKYPFSHRTANYYMSIARNWDWVDSQNVANLSDAVALIAESRRGAAAGDPAEGPGAVPADINIPTFSVLDGRSGPWRARKQHWRALGIESEAGRGDNLLRFSETVQIKGGGTSIFDPVLCELAYLWWCPEGGLVLDPFAGGSVRGVVAGSTGRRYHGIDLREEQCAANREQAAAICPGTGVEWVCGDSREMARKAPMADFLFSCPPYGDLEVYSDDPRDLSQVCAQDYGRFLQDYQAIVAGAARRLKDNRFAVFVVGDFRHDSGIYRNFPAETIAAFASADLRLYNQAILVTSVGSLPVRAGAQWRKARKLGQTHQNVLCFVKGDPIAATAAIDEADV